MTNEELFSGIAILSKALEAQPNPLAKALGLGIGIAMDAIDVAEKTPSVDAVELLRTARDGLRASIAVEVQAALDASSGNG